MTLRFYYVAEDRDEAICRSFSDYVTANLAAFSLSREFPTKRFVVLHNGPVEYHENGRITNPPRWHANVDEQIEAIVSEVSK